MVLNTPSGKKRSVIKKGYRQHEGSKTTKNGNKIFWGVTQDQGNYIKTEKRRLENEVKVSRVGNQGGWLGTRGPREKKWLLHDAHRGGNDAQEAGVGGEGERTGPIW